MLMRSCHRNTDPQPPIQRLRLPRWRPASSARLTSQYLILGPAEFHCSQPPAQITMADSCALMTHCLLAVAGFPNAPLCALFSTPSPRSRELGDAWRAMALMCSLPSSPYLQQPPIGPFGVDTRDIPFARLHLPRLCFGGAAPLRPDSFDPGSLCSGAACAGTYQQL